MGTNPKAVEAKAKKEDVKKTKEAAAAKEQEDREWADAGEGAKSKAQAKKDEQVIITEGTAGLGTFVWAASKNVHACTI